jgi:hypothetical protein
MAIDAYNYLRVDLDGQRLTIRVIGLGGAALDVIDFDAAPARSK